MFGITQDINRKGFPCKLFLIESTFYQTLTCILMNMEREIILIQKTVMNLLLLSGVLALYPPYSMIEKKLRCFK